VKPVSTALGSGRIDISQVGGCRLPISLEKIVTVLCRPTGGMITRGIRMCLSMLWQGIPADRNHASHEAGSEILCVRCGLCCKHLLVKLTRNDMRALARGLHMSAHELLRKYVKMTAIGPVLRQNGSNCVFLSGGEKASVAVCGVYAYRPEVCRAWVPSLSRPECREGLHEQSRARA
jgi:Fe-S-cluster containining protein